MMTRVRKRNVAVAGAVAAAVLAGGASMAAASGNTPSPSGSTTTQQDTSEVNEASDGKAGQEVDAPSYTGSIKAPAEATNAKDSEGNESDASSAKDDAAEAAALAPLAKVAKTAAVDAATAAVPGAAGTVSLDNENGSVVWSVEVTRSNGSVVDVKVDAGNGKVLAQDSGLEGEGTSN